MKKLNYADIYKYTIVGLRAAIIIDYLRQFPVPKLNRKWNHPVVLQKINEYKQKYSHLFKTLNLQEINNLLPKSSNPV